MALWNRSSYLMIARLMPIVLILSAGFFWKHEKQVRLQAERRLKTVSEQLIQSQADLTDAKREAETAIGEKRFLIQQLGERDEHIRRLLAEMIRLLSGSGSVDLGEVLVRGAAPGAWDGVHNELNNIVAQGPINNAVSDAAVAAGRAQAVKSLPALIPAAAPSSGLMQVQVEHRAIPSAPSMATPQIQQPALLQSWTGDSSDTPTTRDSQILTVNGQHRFVVISQGIQDGLKQDAVFEAYTGGNKIGRLRIGTAYDRISTASIIDGDAKLFREGSSVRLEPITV